MLRIYMHIVLRLKVLGVSSTIRFDQHPFSASQISNLLVLLGKFREFTAIQTHLFFFD